MRKLEEIHIDGFPFFLWKEPVLPVREDEETVSEEPSFTSLSAG